MITKETQGIFIKDELFDPKAILTCGQVFRFKEENDAWIVHSKDKRAIITKENDGYNISGDTEFFYNYFDLSNDYQSIINTLADKPLINEALTIGKGIRILKQDPFETIISFIISANNLIPRIKGIIERLCLNLGENMGEYHAFPTAEIMAQQPLEFYTKIGCGYRDQFLLDTARTIANGDFDIEKPFHLTTEEAKKYLMTLKGVGPKVADCILLFAYEKYDVFPVDTWIKKLYFSIFPEKPTTTSPIQMRKELVELYGNYAGIGQQYLFYKIRGK